MTSQPAIAFARKISPFLLVLGLFAGFAPDAAAGQLSFAPATGTLSSQFGWRTDPMHGGRRFHSGIDIAANHGAPIYATQSGQVVYSGKYGGYGNVVVLDHGNSLYTLFAHASRLLVNRGDAVYQGQIIAEVGSSGRSTGPHLHFEVHYNRQYVNPLQYLAGLSMPPMVATAKARPAQPKSVGGVEIIGGDTVQAPVPQKSHKHTVEVVRGQDVEVVRF